MSTLDRLKCWLAKQTLMSQERTRQRQRHRQLLDIQRRIDVAKQRIVENAHKPPSGSGRVIPACRRYGYHMIGLDGRCVTCGAPEDTQT